MLLVADQGFTARISALVEQAGGQNAFARLVGMSQSGVARLVKGGEPTLSTLKLIANATGRTLSWVATGDEVASGGNEIGIAEVPILDVTASAGPGTEVGDEAVIGVIPFPLAILRSLGVTPAKVRAFLARGESMYPTIRDNALVLVDTGNRSLTDGLVYALRGPDGLRLKRIQRAVDGSVNLISDNSSLYPAERVSEADADRIRAVGRAFWTDKPI